MLQQQQLDWQQLPATSTVAAAGQPAGRVDSVDSWMSGHESPTTEAEAVLAAVTPAADQQQQQQQKLKVLRERR
jgi:hypothetical protein